MLDTSELYSAVGGDRIQEPEKDIIERFRMDDALGVPIELTDLDLWQNYVDDDLYVMDKKIREFLKKTRYKREKRGKYRTTASVVFAWIYGRKPGPSDSHVCRMIHEMLRYYCTSYTGQTTYGGKTVSCVYEFSRYATVNKRPYSLRLRLEESDGKTNIWRKSPVDDKGKRRHGRRAHSEDGGATDVGSGDDR